MDRRFCRRSDRAHVSFHAEPERTSPCVPVPIPISSVGGHPQRNRFEEIALKTSVVARRMLTQRLDIEGPTCLYEEKGSRGNCLDIVL